MRLPLKQILFVPKSQGFLFLVFGILLIAPEILFFFGGELYMPALSVMPPVMIGCCFQFAYTFYVNIEHYLKKTLLLSIATGVAATLNLALNYLFIPSFGYIAAAFTTLVGYTALLLLHYLFVRKTEYKNLYDNMFIGKVMLIFLAVSTLFGFLYQHDFLRCCFIVVYIVVFAIIVAMHRKVFTRIKF